MTVVCGLISVKDLLEFISLKPEKVEWVIAGRYAFPQIIEKAFRKREGQKGVSERVGMVIDYSLWF